jgi:hypothetical protein
MQQPDAWRLLGFGAVLTEGEVSWHRPRLLVSHKANSLPRIGHAELINSRSSAFADLFIRRVYPHDLRVPFVVTCGGLTGWEKIPLEEYAAVVTIIP